MISNSSLTLKGKCTEQSDFDVIFTFREYVDDMLKCDININMLEMNLLLSELLFYHCQFKELEKAIMNFEQLNEDFIDVSKSFKMTNKVNGKFLLWNISWNAFYPWFKSTTETGTVMNIWGLQVNAGKLQQDKI
jgi:hypothetical protein